MQTILEDWCTPTDKRIHNIMYLDWTENPEVSWLLNKPKNINFKKVIKWNMCNIDVLVCGNIDTDNLVSQVKFKHTSILKSNIQKCIRRGLVSKSLSTAKVMIKTDFIEFIRRISIIMLEDTRLNKNFNILMWMTAAYPQWQPNKIHINWLLGVVKYLSELPNRDIVNNGSFEFKSNIEKINCFAQVDKSLMYSLYFRMSYGGMKCDMLMIERLMKLWFNRLLQRDNLLFIYDEIQPIEYKVKNIKIFEIEESAVDFHCYPRMLNDIRNKFLEYTKDDIKSSIWHYRSSLNIRENSNLLVKEDIDKLKFLEIWEKIKDEVSKISKKYIKHLSI